MRRLASVATILLLAGCNPAPPNASTKNDWNPDHKRDISCLHNPIYPREDYYDLNGDGRLEVFLVLRCNDPHDPRGDQLEVLAGGGDGNPTKLFLQLPTPSVVDQLCFTEMTAIFRTTSAAGSDVWQVRWPKDKPEPGPRTPGPPEGCPDPK